MSVCPVCYKRIKGKGPNKTKKQGVIRHKTCSSGRYKKHKK